MSRVRTRDMKARGIMKYIKISDQSELLHIKQTPKSMVESYNKLVCLARLDEQFNPGENRFYVKKLSKRRERLVKMFWVFKHEQEGIAKNVQKF